jgi:hypothetical protein
MKDRQEDHKKNNYICNMNWVKTTTWTGDIIYVSTNTNA